MILIEACIGLFFLYLILSLIASSILELIATASRMRGKKLIKAIESIFDEATDNSKKSELYRKFLNHPLYKQLCNPQKNKKDRRAPSYIEPSTFVEIIISILSENEQENNAINGETIKQQINNIVEKDQNGAFKETINYYLKKTEGDVEKLRVELEGWFNNIMNRVSGWYKRKTQKFLFAIGLVMAILLNVNSIYVFESLLEDKATRELIVGQAIKFKENGDETLTSINRIKTDSLKNDTEKLAAIQSTIDSFLKPQAEFLFSNLGMGWTDVAKAKIHKSLQKKGFGGGIIAFLFLLIGWFISALAISLGAPFWFDSLVYLINIRGAGKTLFDKSAPVNTPIKEAATTRIEVNTIGLREDEEIRKKAVG